MSGRARVLFVCTQNSARSQIAEAFLNKLAGDRFEAVSAGLEAGQLNQLVVEAMQEVDIDITQHKTKNVFELFKKGELFAYVIAVCDEITAQKCPTFPGLKSARIAWSFEDPATYTGAHEEKLKRMRKLREAIKQKVIEFANSAER
jgi:arsenate reductase